MLRRRYMIIALGIVSALLGCLIVNNVILAQSGGEYDPWLDYNEDGVIDVNDLSPLGQSYGSSGDPTRTVYIKQSTYYWSTTLNIDPDWWWVCENSTQGYTQMTLTLTVLLGTPTPVEVDLYYHFVVDGWHLYPSMDDFTVLPLETWFETYNASRSPSIRIIIYNPSTTDVAEVAIAIYMIA